MSVETRKTTLDLNLDLLARARQVLGTTGIKDTIDRALYEVIVAEARRQTMARMREIDPSEAQDLRTRAWGR